MEIPMSNQQERLRKVIGNLIENGYVDSHSEFACEVGRDKTYLSRVLNNKTPLTKKFTLSISNRFPSVNGNWILTGEGDMILKESHIGDRIVSARASGNATANAAVTYNNNDTKALQERIKELEQLLIEEKERSAKYWNMIEKLTK